MNNVPFQFYVEPELKGRLERLAFEEGVSMSRLVRELLAGALDKIEATKSVHGTRSA